MKVEINKLTPELFLKLYTSVGWEPPCAEQVMKALENTIATFTAFEDHTAVGMVRLIGDGGMSFYMKDFAVVPSWQSEGVESLLIDAMEQYISNSSPENQKNEHKSVGLENEKSPIFSGFFDGSPGKTRTYNPSVNRGQNRYPR